LSACVQLRCWFIWVCLCVLCGHPSQPGVSCWLGVRAHATCIIGAIHNSDDITISSWVDFVTISRSKKSPRFEHGTLHNRPHSPQHSEITAFCRLWLCAAVALDETNDRTDYSQTGYRFTTGPVTSPSQSDRQQSSISTKIGAFSK